MFDVRRLRVLSSSSRSRAVSRLPPSALGMTQSAVSQHIAALEREIGLAVVRRGTRPVELTEAGSALTRHATGILARLEAAEQEVAEIAERRRGRLRFGCFPTVLGTLMPAAFARFRRSAPGRPADRGRRPSAPARPSAGERRAGSRRDLRPRGVARCRVPERFERTPLLADRFQAVLPAAHPLARRRAIRLQDLREEPWIGGAPSSGWYRIVRHACQQAGFNPRADFASDDYIAVQALVAAGLGVSVIPGLAVQHPLPGVAVRPARLSRPGTAHLRRVADRRLPGSDADAMVDCLD